MAVNKEQIEHLANLARLNIEKDKAGAYAAQIGKILEFVNILQKIDTSAVGDNTAFLPIVNRFREDTAGDSQSTDDTFKNAPDRKDNFIKMPKILDND